VSSNEELIKIKSFFEKFLPNERKYEIGYKKKRKYKKK